ncbi:MAG: archease [Flavobacteriaceae bacterium]|nr:archease [Flavobacteriaceae bacterium]
MPIEYRSHTADIQMVIKADDFQQLFELSLEGMSNILVHSGCITTYDEQSQEIEISGQDTTNLLIDFLSEALSYTYVNKVLYCKLHVLALNDRHIKALLFGLPIQSLDEEIKAVTYHEAKVEQDIEGKWSVSIIFDI